MTTGTNGVDVVVVGAGVVGLAVAWRVAQSGASVVVCDPSPATGASWAAAGMLAPVTEARCGEEDLAALGVASMLRWPRFAAELEAGSGCLVGLREEATLAVALDDDDRRALDELAEVHRALGLASRHLGARACRELEPMLQPRLRGGLVVEGDHQVDPRAVLQALIVASGAAGAVVRRVAVRSIDHHDGRVRGVVLGDGSELGTSAVVVAAGACSGPFGVPVRPVKGQILRLRAEPATMPLSRTLRALVHGWPVYLVPRCNGELVIGATMEEQGFDTTVTAGAVHELLAAAIEVVPDVGELELVETTARCRPATPDNGPIIGAGALEGLFYATGHHRNGVLLAPITAEALLAALERRRLPEITDRFSLARFG